MSMYHFRVIGLPKDADFDAMPFGRQLEHLRAIEAFKLTAKSVHVSRKRTTFKKALADFKRLYKPKQYFCRNTETSYSYDDSFEVWYTL